MTLRPGDRAVFRGLTARPDGSRGKLPPTIGVVVAASADGLVIRLRIGGVGSRHFAPKSRTCAPENVARLATAREIFSGMVIDPLPTT